MWLKLRGFFETLTSATGAPENDKMFGPHVIVRIAVLAIAALTSRKMRRTNKIKQPFWAVFLSAAKAVNQLKS